MSPSSKDVTSLPSQTIYIPTNASFLGACIPSIATLVKWLGTDILGESPAANWGFSAVGWARYNMRWSRGTWLPLSHETAVCGVRRRGILVCHVRWPAHTVGCGDGGSG